MNIENHGGGCCGVTHIFNFFRQDKDTVNTFKKDVKRFLDQEYEDSQINGYETEGWYDDYEDFHSDRKFSCILEACLTDAQMVFWAPHFKEVGFKIVNRFFNSNSGNVVNVLHYNPAGAEGEARVGKAPYKW